MSACLGTFQWDTVRCVSHLLTSFFLVSVSLFDYDLIRPHPCGSGRKGPHPVPHPPPPSGPTNPFEANIGASLRYGLRDKVEICFLPPPRDQIRGISDAPGERGVAFRRFLCCCWEMTQSVDTGLVLHLWGSVFVVLQPS